MTMIEQPGKPAGVGSGFESRSTHCSRASVRRARLVGLLLQVKQVAQRIFWAI
jgi:hypothetical protein